ncbi:hypothetical protein [Streptomyces sp. B21-083]|uniref:hypothetical protein n=1 Tax=Streptomyces sp. B21-083 TaxID=3039410 RepID=UPI002FF023B8
MASLALQPLVIGPRDIPAVESLDEATRDVPMAVLSAILHADERSADGTLKLLAAALSAMEARDPERAGLLAEFTSQGLGRTEAFKIWSELLKTDTSFFTSLVAEGIRAEGEAKGLAHYLLHRLERRDIPVSDADQDRITTCEAPETLTRWIDRAITATSTAEVFAEDPAAEQK